MQFFGFRRQKGALKAGPSISYNKGSLTSPVQTQFESHFGTTVATFLQHYRYFHSDGRFVNTANLLTQNMGSLTQNSAPHATIPNLRLTSYNRVTIHKEINSFQYTEA